MTVGDTRFESYSANFEDVLLHRIFGHMPCGVFVDVGAADPRMENDCKALYDQGWSGINVEPNPSLYRALLEQRPRDRSFNCALGESADTRRYFEVEGTGLSTLDTEEAERCRANGWTVIEHRVAVRTLASILDETGVDHVDFLKVDVEGWEEPVLRGNDWSRFRPSVIMVEATLPERPERRETGIEAFLAGHGYALAHFDGLNDFFVRTDFDGAKDAFRLPPNVFDRFESYQLPGFRHRIGQLEADLVDARGAIEIERTARSDAEQALDLLQVSMERQNDEAKRDHAALQERLDLAAHELLDMQGDCKQLRAAVLGLQTRETAYAERIAATHRDREELRILRAQVGGLHHAIHGLEHRLADMGALAEQHRLAGAEVAEWMAAIRRSTSWRLSLPLRVGGRTLGRLHRRIGRAV